MIDELKTHLEANGWKFEGRHDGLNHQPQWTAYKATEGLPFCELNNKPPTLIITPWVAERTAYAAFEIDLRAACKDRQAVLIKVYGLTTIEALEPAIKKLEKAWIGVSFLSF